MTVTVRPRKGAAPLQARAPQDGQRGRPELKGDKLGTLSQIAQDPATV